jgi:pentatricopeptide repeat protein
VNNNLFEEALNLFEEIPFQLDEVQYVIVYNACASLCNERAMTLGEKILGQMPKEFLNDIVVISSIIHMLMRFNQVENAEYYIKQIKKFDVYTYGILINGYKINHQPKKCLALFEEMKKKNMKINEAIALSLVGACSQIGIRSISENIVQQISHFQNDLKLKSCLIDMWVSIHHFVSNCFFRSFLHRENQVILIALNKSFNLLFNLISSLILASVSFEEIISHSIQSFLVNAYGRNGMGYEAIDVYQRIPENMRDTISHVCVLNACSHSGLVEQARSIFSQIKRKTEEIVTTMVCSIL